MHQQRGFQFVRRRVGQQCQFAVEVFEETVGVFGGADGNPHAVFHMRRFGERTQVQADNGFFEPDAGIFGGCGGNIVHVFGLQLKMTRNHTVFRSRNKASGRLKNAAAAFSDGLCGNPPTLTIQSVPCFSDGLIYIISLKKQIKNPFCPKFGISRRTGVQIKEGKPCSTRFSPC